MTRDEFTDTVASMTPRQREVMAVFGNAVLEAACAGSHAAEVMDEELGWMLEVPMCGRLLNAVYPNAIPERD